MKKSLLTFLTIASTTFVLNKPAHAGGLDLTLTYGSRYVALGGQQVAIATDAYSPLYNPAGMAFAESNSFAANFSPLVLQYGAPIGAANTQRSSEIGFGPLFYLGTTYRLMDRVTLGFAVYPGSLQGGKFKNVDYGTGVNDKEYSNFLARIEIAPSIAVKLCEHFSLGASYRIGYTKYEKNGGLFEVPGIIPPTYVDSSISGWDGKGLKVAGFLSDFHGLSAAVTYRLQVDTTLSGTTRIDNGAGSSPLPTKQKVKIPSQLQAGVSYDIIPKTLLVAFTYEFTENSVIEDDNPTVTGLPANTLRTPLHYKNGHSMHLGSEYTMHLDDAKKLRFGAGLAYDSAVTRKEYPNPVIPPAAPYFGGALGAQYDMSSQVVGLALNYGQYSHTTTAVNSTDSATLPFSVFPGKYSLKVFLAALDYQYRF